MPGRALQEALEAFNGNTQASDQGIPVISSNFPEFDRKQGGYPGIFQQ